MCTDGKTILVVEDDLQIRETLAGLLDEEGFDVMLAKHGLDAITQLKDESLRKPCVILLDLMMPVMDGMQFRAEQLQDAVLAKIPVVVLSADATLSAKVSLLHVDNALRKPFRLAEVLEAIGRYCH